MFQSLIACVCTINTQLLFNIYFHTSASGGPWCHTERGEGRVRRRLGGGGEGGGCIHHIHIGVYIICCTQIFVSRRMNIQAIKLWNMFYLLL